MNLIFHLLRKNTSTARLAGFLVSNLIGLAIIGIGMQFYLDARSIWSRSDSFLNSDFMAVNKHIDASHTLSGASTDFTPEEIADISAQPWVSRVGRFSRARFNVHASVGLDAAQGGERRMSTAMFFEAVPDEFLDITDGSFTWNEEDTDVPVIISKDYLALYNFGFAGAAGLPRLSESLISGIPLQLRLTSEDGTKHILMNAHVAGYSNRFNTILVPQNFLEYMNAIMAAAPTKPESSVSNQSITPDAAQKTDLSGEGVSRLIIDVSSPGDTAISDYLKAHDYEVAGDKNATAATYMLRIISGIVIAVGLLITILSLFILILSMSLLMEKNQRKIHSLLMLGYQPDVPARPYWRITLWIGSGAVILAILCVLLLRQSYISALTSLGGEPTTPLWTILTIILLGIIIILINCRSIIRRVHAAWR